MTEQKINETKRYLKGYVTNYHLKAIVTSLETTPDSKFMLIRTMSLRIPFACVILSILFGWLGIDRFVVGDGGLGVLKFLTCGGFFIWALIDIFCIGSRAKEKNYNDIIKVI